MSTDTPYALAEFERWCEGEGRGEEPGRHYRALQMIANFKKFKAARAVTDTTEENDNVEHDTNEHGVSSRNSKT